MGNIILVNVIQKTIGSTPIINNNQGSNVTNYTVAKQFVVDIDDICTPIRSNPDGTTYFGVTSNVFQSIENRNVGIIYITCTDTLSSISLSHSEIVSLTVVSKNLQPIANKVMGFYTGRINGIIDTDSKTGNTRFQYLEDGAPNQITYEVVESPSTIVAENSGGGGGAFVPLAGTDPSTPLTGTIEFNNSVSHSTTILWQDSTKAGNRDWYFGYGNNRDLSLATDFKGLYFYDIGLGQKELDIIADNVELITIDSTASVFVTRAATGLPDTGNVSIVIQNAVSPIYSVYDFSYSGINLSTQNPSFKGITNNPTTSGYVGANQTDYTYLDRINNDARYGSRIIPTSTTGLPSGALWNNSGILSIVP